MVSFKIIENYDYSDKFESFESDFLENIPVADLCKKYSIPRSIWLKWRVILKEKHPHLRRWNPNGCSLKKKEYIRIPLKSKTISITPKGNYLVFRRVKGKGRVSYGTYDSRDCAEYVLSELLKYDWNKYVAYDLIRENAVTASKRCLLSTVLTRDL